MKSSNNSQQRVGRASFLGRKVDLLDHYEKKLEHLEDSVRMEQSLVTGKVCIISYFKHLFFEFWHIFYGKVASYWYMLITWQIVSDWCQNCLSTIRYTSVNPEILCSNSDLVTWWFPIAGWILITEYQITLALWQHIWCDKIISHVLEFVLTSQVILRSKPFILSSLKHVWITPSITTET